MFSRGGRGGGVVVVVVALTLEEVKEGVSGVERRQLFAIWKKGWVVAAGTVGDDGGGRGKQGEEGGGEICLLLGSPLLPPAAPSEGKENQGSRVDSGCDNDGTSIIIR